MSLIANRWYDFFFAFYAPWKCAKLHTYHSCTYHQPTIVGWWYEQLWYAQTLLRVTSSGNFLKMAAISKSLIQHARLVCWDHVLDVDKGILSSVSLQQLQGFFNQVAHVLAFILAVVDAIATVHCKIGSHQYNITKYFTWKKNSTWLINVHFVLLLWNLLFQIRLYNNLRKKRMNCLK